MTSVAVLGGGVGGLSAAHELIQRGFDVTVYERGDTFGGKARSMPVPGSGTGGRPDLPGEHGFRFFPGFYRHLPDTMKRIPSGQQSVFNQLVAATRMMLARADVDNEIIGPTALPESFDDLKVTVDFIWEIGTQLDIPPLELADFYERLLTFLTSCDQRRLGEFEEMGWWEFVDADQRSQAFQKYLATGMTRTLVAAQAREMSARTGCQILWQLLFDMARPGEHADRVLNGPTSEVWIDKWTDYLQSRGVVLRGNCEVTGIECDGRRITGVSVKGVPGLVHADHYVAAIPVEKLQPLLTPAIVAAEPRLVPVQEGKLTVRWMNGMMFYLDHDVELVDGHIIFIDSEWALTGISQQQFWPNVDLAKRGDGKVHGILSVDISDWDTPGSNHKPAKNCSKQEVHDEVWAQLVAEIDDGSLDPNNVHTWFLDPAIQFPSPGEATNDEPLLVNTAGSWWDRPDAVTRIPNFFIASDFVQTYTDLATMEGANEAARRAVNGILKATGSRAAPCGVWKLHEPFVLTPFRMLDEVLWRLHLPPLLPFHVTSKGELRPTNPVTGGVHEAIRRGRAVFNSFAARRP
jgi:uncharacterized protein with NAD-binding domain and iron-sulfur cluster